MVIVDIFLACDFFQILVNFPLLIETSLFCEVIMSNFDSKFFTNEPGSTLYDRFKLALQHTKYFDVLVGYFRASGFYRLQEAFDNVEKVRILIGLNIDKNSYDAIRKSKSVDSIRTHETLQNETEQATVLDI